MFRIYYYQFNYSNINIKFELVILKIIIEIFKQNINDYALISLEK